ncbi:MAG: hypothetical protein AABW50_01545 [Nanoarchaeota archaeon]
MDQCGNDLSRKTGKVCTFLELCGTSQDLVLVLSALDKKKDIREKYSISIDDCVKQVDRIERYLEDLKSSKVYPPVLKEGEDEIALDYFLKRGNDLKDVRLSLINLRDKRPLSQDESKVLMDFYDHQQKYCLQRLDELIL